MYLFLWLRLNWLQTDFGNDFLENGDVWLLLQIRSNWKAFLVDRIWEPKERKWFFISIFTSNDFRPWKIEERERERESITTSPSVDITGWRGREREREKERIDRDITGWRGSADRDCDRNWRFDLCAMRRSSRDCNHDRRIARSADRDRDRDLSFVCPDLMTFFWILFVFWGINDIIYSFGNRENLRKCEKMWATSRKCVFYDIFENTTKYQ